jgi:hypothetical protein
MYRRVLSSADRRAVGNYAFYINGELKTIHRKPIRTFNPTPFVVSRFSVAFSIPSYIYIIHIRYMICTIGLCSMRVLCTYSDLISVLRVINTHYDIIILNIWGVPTRVRLGNFNHFSPPPKKKIEYEMGFFLLHILILQVNTFLWVIQVQNKNPG